MFRNTWPLAMLVAGWAATTSIAQAHEIVGDRFFPATLAIDDPGVNDELASSTFLPNFRSASLKISAFR